MSRTCCHIAIVKFLQTISRQWTNDPRGHRIRKRRGDARNAVNDRIIPVNESRRGEKRPTLRN